MFIELNLIGGGHDGGDSCDSGDSCGYDSHAATATHGTAHEGEHFVSEHAVTATYTVTGMTCGHCVASVTDEVSAIEGVTGVQVDLPTGKVTVSSAAPLAEADVRAAVDEAGYQLVG
jgi:copper chaperone